MKTSTLFTALLATALFAPHVQAQDASASGNARTSAQGSIQADTAAGNAAIARNAQAAANAQGRASGALEKAARVPSNAGAQAGAQGDAAADTLARRYADVAGSVDAAADIVAGLHSGIGKHAAMAYGEIDATLALASQLMADNEAVSLDAAIGAVLDLRADGLGWGQVAQGLGYNLGDVASTAHASGAQAAQGVKGAVSSTLATATNLPAGKQIDVEANGSRVGIGVDASAAGKARTERPAVDLRANGRINVGADVRPNLPLVRPLLGR